MNLWYLFVTLYNYDFCGTYISLYLQNHGTYLLFYIFMIFVVLISIYIYKIMVPICYFI